MMETNSKQIHREAMQYAQEGMIAHQTGQQEKAMLYYEKAFELEKQAAMSFLEGDKQPTRAILFRSAASLAQKCNKISESQKLITLGLAGNPPQEIAEELRSLRKNILASRQKRPFSIRGFLRVADSTKNIIQIINDAGTIQKIVVPNGLAEIVKIFWEEEVSATVVKERHRMILRELNKAS
jgi:hypothetical protein